MALQSVLNAGERASLEQLVREHNSTLNQGRIPQQDLGRDDFLKILITQLSYQDPTSPMEDKEFIAQMAQFSTLEQMTSMAGDFARLTEMLTNTEASSALGRSVELNVALPGDEEERVVQGVVRAVTRGTNPQVLVNGTYYDWTQVSRVFEE
ncbi:MAG: flagellar hook assembly protein FlgD [Treponema sp.]|jgi:flagellar basal-body rod modification protein FlgD|nr:flagellar hook assembly protein FlgD [Treponema sp.]